jgi:hypothetical protein
VKRFFHHSSSVIASFVLVFVCLAISTRAQQSGVGFNRHFGDSLDRQLNSKKISVHSNIQPAIAGFDTLIYSFSGVQQNKNSLSFRPVYALQGGFQAMDSTAALGYGFAGLEANWSNKNKWFFRAGYSLTGGQMPGYLQSFAAQDGFIAGSGYAIRDGKNLYHAHYTHGSLAYNQGKHFHFELGKGKHFWGDGHRSLILGDNASSVPYARITTNVWKLRYTNLWMQLRDNSFGQTSLKDVRTKYAALHALSFNTTNKFNITIYEMVVWQDRDSMSRRTLDMGYLNPIIFYRPVEYAIGSPDNVILALSMRYKAHKHLQLYWQFVLDEFNLTQFRKQQKWWGNKFGGQFGLKWFDITPGLSWQSEINIARPFTYTHGSSVQAWTHFNQPMAHPLGANFVEWSNLWRYDMNTWTINAQFNWSVYGRDYDSDGNGTIDNFGGNINRSYRNPHDGAFGHPFLQGLHTTLLFGNITLSKKIPQLQDAEAFIQYTHRIEQTQLSSRTDGFISIGIKMQGLLEPVRDY